MRISVNITENNRRLMKRKLNEYNAINRTNMDFDSFAELVFINGLLSVMTGIEGSSRRKGSSFNSERN